MAIRVNLSSGIFSVLLKELCDSKNVSHSRWTVGGREQRGKADICRRLNAWMPRDRRRDQVRLPSRTSKQQSKESVEVEVPAKQSNTFSLVGQSLSLVGCVGIACLRPPSCSCKRCAGEAVRASSIPPLTPSARPAHDPYYTTLRPDTHPLPPGPADMACE